MATLEEFLTRYDPVQLPFSGRLTLVMRTLAEASVNAVWVGTPSDGALIDGVWDWHSGVDRKHINLRVPELLDVGRPERMRQAHGVNFIPCSTRVAPDASDKLIEFLCTGPEGETRSVILVSLP